MSSISSFKYDFLCPFTFTKWQFKLSTKQLNSLYNSWLAIVPVVGVDAIGKRIGFGKGMYDRFFGRLPYKPTLVFTQRILCQSEKILSESYDIQADYIITN